jgi:hypothetical protein
MRFLLALLLPLMVWAAGTPIGNPAGVVLGIFAMCGTDPVDCGNGWCCLAGQTCTDGSRGPDTSCIDSQLTDNSGYVKSEDCHLPCTSKLILNYRGGTFTVNAAYFGKVQQQHVSPPGVNGSGDGSTTANQTTTTNASRHSAQPASFILISALIGSISLLLSSL